VYWPYAYTDLFYFTFWPRAYEVGYWAYAYDDFFDGIFFPYGAPYVNYAHQGPYEYYASAGTTTGSAAAPARVPGEVTKPVAQVCREPDSGITAWPFERIEKAVNPSDEQQALLAELKQAADEAADRFKEACPEYVPMTPTGRLAVMMDRLQATFDAVRLVRPPLEKFYQSLSDEQQARFNAIGPDLGKKPPPAGPDEARAECGGDKAGLTVIPIERIETVLDPTAEQAAQLEKLSGAVDQAAETLAKACPNDVPLTPVGRLEVMQLRLEAMLEAGRTVRPPLEEFYASLTSEQKARFNRLGRETASSDR
jgi:hypothetical protein